MRHFLVCFLAAVGTVQLAHASNSSAQLDGDIAFMYGEIEQVSGWEEICSAHFPATKNQNVAAVIDWRKRNHNLVREIDGRFSAVVEAKSKGDAARHRSLVAHFQKARATGMRELEQMLVAGGAERFQKQCVHYPEYLKSPAMNMELSRKDILQSIRRGAK